MTWIAIADRENARFEARGLSGARAGADDPEQELRRGSLLLETRLSPEDRPQLLVGLERGFEHGLSFMLKALPGGGVTLVHSRGEEMLHATLRHDAEAQRTDVLRITYSWDRDHDWARLVIERPDMGRSFQTILRGPVRMTLEDIREMVLNPAAGWMSEDVCFLAASDRIEPIGPMPGLTEETPVLTSLGIRAVGALQRGDLVETLEGSLQPVLHVVKRTVPARGLFRPVRLRHPYFGLKADIVVAPYQRIVVGGSRVEYLFGAEQVLVPASHLVKGSAAVREHDQCLVTYCQVVLPDHQAVQTAGTYVETMDVGRIRRKPEILKSSLFGHLPRNTLPEHRGAAYPVLGDYEAIVLSEQRAA